MYTIQILVSILRLYYQTIFQKMAQYAATRDNAKFRRKLRSMIRAWFPYPRVPVISIHETFHLSTALSMSRECTSVLCSCS